METQPPTWIQLDKADFSETFKLVFLVLRQESYLITYLYYIYIHIEETQWNKLISFIFLSTDRIYFPV